MIYECEVPACGKRLASEPVTVARGLFTQTEEFLKT